MFFVRIDNVAEVEPDVGIWRIKKGLQRPLRRALNATKPVIRKEIRRRYTYKGAIPIRTHVSQWSGQLNISGARNKAERFKLKEPRRGSYLTVNFLRGKATVFKKGFYWAAQGTYFERISKPRFPVRSIKGPSIAEMAGHAPTPVTAIEAALFRNLEKHLPQYFEGLV